MHEQKGQLAQTYECHHKEGGRYGYLFCHGERGPYLKQWIGTGKKVLDLGCRDGALTEFFASGNTVVGVDIDSQALERIQRRLGIETYWLDLNTEWPFASESFDVIISCEILEHVFFLPQLLDKIYGSLKGGGKFIGSVPNAFRMRNRWKFLWGELFDKDPTHVRLFSHAILQQMLSRRFQELKIVPIQGKIAPFFPVRPSLPMFLARLFAKDLLWCAHKGKK